MGSTPFIGEIIMFAGNFAIRDWALCDGQLLGIASNTALFSILGTQYGGDGETTFGLPDLRGRVPMHAGNGPGIPNHPIGQKAGSEATTLNVNHLPPHSHTAVIKASSAEGTSAVPNDHFLAKSSSGEYTSMNTDTELNAGSVAVGNTGSGLGHSNMQPYATVNFIIALQGIYPSRN